jgi:xanthine dehydrogenase accessory factor
VDGWIGGHCTEEEIVRNALECLKEGRTKFLNLSTCQGGRMVVYLEPYLPNRRLVIFGHVPIVEALVRLAKSLNFTVTVIDQQESKEKLPEADIVLNSLDDEYMQKLLGNTNETYAVIATMGEYDLENLTKLCSLTLPYIGVVAGKKRANAIYSYLRSIRIPEEKIGRIRAPAGIYIRAVTAEEIALSIMAEIIDVARSQNSRDSLELAQKSRPEQSFSKQEQPLPEIKLTNAVTIDPVCGMTVSGTSDYYLDLNGQVIFFCCAACKESFETDPKKYVLAKSG